MTIKVLYQSWTGNTRKLATAIAEALGVQAEELQKDTVLTEQTNLLLLGSGVYVGKPKKKTVKFIAGLTPETVKYAAVFGTCGGKVKVGDDLSALLSARGIAVAPAPFMRKSQSWESKNSACPSQEERQATVAFAQECRAAAQSKA